METAKKIQTPQKPSFSNSNDVWEAWESTLASRFIGLNEAIKAAAVGVITQLPVLLIGPPGTAKTALASSVAKLLGIDFIFIQLNRYLTPDHIFGLPNPAAIAAGRVEILGEGTLLHPRPYVALLDEVSRGSPAVISMLMSVLNEMRISYYGQTYDLSDRIVALFGTTNFVPTEEEWDAFFDRWVLRVFVEPVQDNKALLHAWISAVQDGLKPILSPETLEQYTIEAAKRVKQMILTEKLLNTFDSLLKTAESQLGRYISPRRKTRAAAVAGAISVYYNSKYVTPLDMVDALLMTFPLSRNEYEALKQRLEQDVVVPQIAREIKLLESNVAEIIDKLKSGNPAPGDIAAAERILQRLKELQSKYEEYGRRIRGGEIERLMRKIREALQK